MAFLWHQQCTGTSQLSMTMSFTITQAEHLLIVVKVRFYKEDEQQHLLIVGKVRFYEEDEQTDAQADGKLLFCTQTLIPRDTALYCPLKQANA